MTYPFENQPQKALEFLQNLAEKEVVGSIVSADNGIKMYTPDGVKNYNALWTRDFTYMLQNAGEFIPTKNAMDCIDYLLSHVHEGSCWLPDRVYANEKVNYSAGEMPYEMANLDNNCFIMLALDVVLSRLGKNGKSYFEKWENTITTALNSLAKDENGLIYNSPEAPHSPYGFTDCICKTGTLMMESLLYWEAETKLAKWQKAYGKDYKIAENNAKKVEENLISVFENEKGMLNSATKDCKQTDIWGSCYAVYIGFPMKETLKKSIANYLAKNYNGLVEWGQLRHTEVGTYWQKLLCPVNEGEYQNGAFWATPSGWLIATLNPYYPDLAKKTLQDLTTYFYYEGAYECINGKDYKKLIHYTASASNILPIAKLLLK